MTQEAPKLLEPTEAASALVRALDGQGRDFTIADAAAKSGLALRDAERGLHALVSEYRGHLRVTNEGELLFRFPNGFTKPWITRSWLERVGARIGGGFVGLLRFIVRAWVAISLIGYAAIFIALVIGLAFARSSGSNSRNDRGFGFDLGFVFFRVIADALFWTFHPFSPVSVAYYDPGWTRNRQVGRAKEKGPPFYEKVNRFFFGPEDPPVDPLAMEKRILAEIRAQKGRIGLADVMRVTGLPRDEADPLMARLMLDYDGSVEVSEDGGISYRFAELRKTVEESPTPRPKPVWAKRQSLTPLTGNGIGTNLLIGGLNGFNLLMSLWALDHHLTLGNLALLFERVPFAKLPAVGTPIALGVVPLVFSIALFALPLARALYRPFKARKIARENARREVLRAVLDGVDHGGVTDEALKAAWHSATGKQPDSKELTREVVALGGDVDLDRVEDGVRYRFPDLEAEATALAAEREAAGDEEAKVGPVVFSSET